MSNGERQASSSQRWEATWIERRIVRGIVYASSKTDAAKRIRSGEGAEVGGTEPSRQSVQVEGITSAWRTT